MVDSAGIVLDVFTHTGSRGSQVVAKLLLHGALPDSVLRHITGQVTGCHSTIRGGDGSIKLRAETPITRQRATQMAESFLAFVTEALIERERASTEALNERERASKVVSIDRGKEYRNRPPGLR